MAISLPKIGKIDVPEIPYTKVDDEFEELLNKTIDAANKQIESAEKQANDQIASAEKKYQDLAGKVDDIIDDAVKQANAIKDTAIDALKKQISSLEGKIKDTTDWANKEIDKWKTKLNEAVEKAADTVTKGIDDAKKWAQDQIDAVTKKANELIGKLQDEIKVLKEKLKEAGENIVEDAKDLIDKVNPFDDMIEDVKKKWDTFKWVAIIGGAILVIGGIALVWYLITHRKELRQEQMDVMNQTMQMSNMMAKSQAQMMLAPVSEAAHIVTQNPEATQLAVRAGTAYGTGGMSEMAPAAGGMLTETVKKTSPGLLGGEKKEETIHEIKKE